MRWSRWFLLILLAFGLGACATTDDEDEENPKLTPDPGVSLLPWSVPQSWEGRGMLGAYSDYFDRR